MLHAEFQIARSPAPLGRRCVDRRGILAAGLQFHEPPQVLVDSRELLALAVESIRHRPPRVARGCARFLIHRKHSAIRSRIANLITVRARVGWRRSSRAGRGERVQERSPPRQACSAARRGCGRVGPGVGPRRAVHVAARKSCAAKRLPRVAPRRGGEHPALRESKGHGSQSPALGEPKRYAPRGASARDAAPHPARSSAPPRPAHAPGTNSVARPSATRSPAASIHRPGSTRETRAARRRRRRTLSLAGGVSQFLLPQLRGQRLLNPLQRRRGRGQHPLAARLPS